MADNWHSCPADIFDDERLEGAPLSSITGYCVLVMLADDHGIFDAAPRTMGRKFGCASSEVASMLADLAKRKLIQLYECNDGQRERQAGIIIGFHSYRGHPDRRAYPSKRRASVLPFPDGERVMPRRQRDEDAQPRKKRGSGAEAAGKKRGSDVEASVKSVPTANDAPAKAADEGAWQERGSDVEVAWQERGNKDPASLIRNARVRERVEESRVEESRVEMRGAPSAPASKPTPAGSTDARASSALPSPTNGSAVPGVASAPALWGAGSAPEVRAVVEQPRPVDPVEDWDIRRETLLADVAPNPLREDVRAWQRGPPPRRQDYASTEGYQAARQAWLASGSGAEAEA